MRIRYRGGQGLTKARSDPSYVFLRYSFCTHTYRIILLVILRNSDFNEIEKKTYETTKSFYSLTFKLHIAGEL